MAEPPRWREGGEMKLTVNRYSIEIAPDNATDEAYIEEVLGLKKDGDTTLLIRKNAFGLRCIAYLEARRVADKDKD